MGSNDVPSPTHRRRAVAGAAKSDTMGRLADRHASRTLATVLFTDIVDSTQTLSAIGDERWAELIQRHNDVCRRVFDRMDAWAVKSTGDGFLACLATPAKGVQCAEQLRAAMPDIGLRLRAGLHTGEMERIDVDDVAGLTVNIAARISRLAGPDELLVSRLTSELLVGSRHTVQPHGVHALKGVTTPMEVFRIDEPLVSPTPPTSLPRLKPSIDCRDGLLDARLPPCGRPSGSPDVQATQRNNPQWTVSSIGRIQPEPSQHQGEAT